MAEAGRKGLVWDEATLKRFIAGPEKLVPGNRMIVNRGPVTDPAQQDAVINLLKRDAMGDAQ
jgi:cytochrome c2